MRSALGVRDMANIEDLGVKGLRLRGFQAGAVCSAADATVVRKAGRCLGSGALVLPKVSGVRSHRVDGIGAPIEEDSALCCKDRY